jgi:urease accessory protein
MPEVQLTNPGGGALGGDRLNLQVTVGAGAAATILTQGATKAYRGVETAQRARVSIEADGVLEYLPHHVIPFARSRWRQETVVELSSAARLLAWEAFAAGRVARGERFAFDRLSSRTVVLRDGTPVLIDGFELEGGGEPFNGWSYLATVQVLAPVRLDGLADELHTSLSEVPGARASASAPAEGLACARVLAQSAPSLARTLGTVRVVARSALGLEAPPRPLS